MKYCKERGKEMANAVIKEKGREKMCKSHAGDMVLPKIKYIAYGEGGVDEAGTPLPVTGEEVSLRNELLRREVDSHGYPIPTTCEYKSSLGKTELAQKYISEVGLFDEEGDLVMYRTFLKKGKDDDMLFDFSIQEIF